MKTRFLTAGRKYQYTDLFGGKKIFTFVRRTICHIPGHARSTFQCDDYRGLNGADDKGFVELTDRQVNKGIATL